MSRKILPKSPLKPSHEVYHRLRWDPRFAATPIYVGIDDHRGARKEIPLHQFVPDGEIPWHRIWHFRTSEGMLWDRKTRVDRILGSGDPNDSTEATAIVPARMARISRRQGGALRFVDGRGWVEVEDRENEPVRPLRLLVLNVLSDTYDAERLRTCERWDHLIDRLEHEESDLIALVEVTTTLERRLLDAPWVRHEYVVTTRAHSSQLGPFGALLLSRVSLRNVEWMGIADVRPALIADVAMGDMGVRIAVIHQPSDRRASKETARAQQLDALTDALLDGQPRAARPTMIVGDFNASEAEPLPPRSKVFSDVWVDLHPGEPGFTFDPPRNAIAALNSAHGMSARLDRVLFVDPTATLWARTCSLWGESAIDGTDDLFLSDHAGLRVDFSPRTQQRQTPMSPTLASVSPTHHTALVLIPPVEIWAPIQSIRRQLDRTFDRWMPHINLLYGFIPESQFDEAAALVGEVLSGSDPFEIALDVMGMFEHRASTSIHLLPTCTPADALHRCQALLQQRFPQCDELGQRAAGGYTPHMTLAQFTSVDAARAKLGEWQKSWAPLRFQTTELCLIARDGDTPFRIVKRVAIGTLTTSWSGPLYEMLKHAGTWPDAHDEARIHAAVNKLDTIAGRILHGENAPNVTALFGSTVLGTRARGGDVDVLVRGTTGVSAGLFFDQVVSEIAGVVGRVVGRVDDASIQVLKLDIDGVAIDLAYTVEGDEMAWRAWAGVEDGRILKGLLDEGHPDARRVALRGLRTWAKARRLEGTQLGFPGGLAWTVLFLWAIRETSSRDSAEDLLAHAFAKLAAWDAKAPIAITPAGVRMRAKDRTDKVVVMTPSSPSFNSTRTFTTSTQAILRRELTSASNKVTTAQQNGSWAHVFRALDPETTFDEQIAITLTSTEEAHLRDAAGWLASAMPKWIVVLEEQGLQDVWPLGDMDIDPSTNGFAPGAHPRRFERSWRLGLRAQRAVIQSDTDALRSAITAHLESHAAEVEVRVTVSRLP